MHSPRAESDLRVSLLDNGLVGPYSATVLVTSFSPGSSTCASRVRSLNSDLPNNTEIMSVSYSNPLTPAVDGSRQFLLQLDSGRGSLVVQLTRARRVMRTNLVPLCRGAMQVFNKVLVCLQGSGELNNLSSESLHPDQTPRSSRRSAGFE
ncbi:hypothetical protein TNCV_4903171 [Trichonephila clavipes]|nr:hypothetical protein TNCV_4903171 [Trichonephila clavipes]